MVEFFTTLFASTTFIIGAWISIAVLVAILLEFEKEGWATTFVSLGIALLMWNYRADIWDVVSQNPWPTVGFVVSYIIIGIVWSFIRWTTYVKRTLGRIKKVKDEFIAEHKEINDANRAGFNQMIEKLRLKDSDGYTISVYDTTTLGDIIKKVTPVASEKKTIITAWISYWPMSLVGTLLNNPFRNFFEWLYDKLSGYYDKITNKYKQDILG
jgi:hypothetical protein